MLLLHFLDVLVIFLLNVEYIFLHFFVQATISLTVKLYKTISIKYNLKNNITLFSSIAHGFFNTLTAQMVNDLNDNQNKKPKNTLLKSESLDHFLDTSTILINHSTGITSPPLFYTKRHNKLQMPKFELFPKNIKKSIIFSSEKYSSTIYTSFF